MNQSISAYEIQKENTGSTSTEINDNLFSHIDFGPLKMYLDDDNITDISTYSGTIAVGESGTVDLSLTGVKAGEGKINVKVTYEDAEGKTGTVSDTFDITVKEPVVETVVEEAPQTNNTMLIAGVVIAVLLLIIIVGAIKRARDKKFE